MKFLYLRLVMLILTDNILTASGGASSVFGALFLRNNDKRIEENNLDEAQIEISETESKITALRIEFIKNQILKKLRLKERPIISVGDLPKPLIDADHPIFPNQDEEYPNNRDYYGKTQQLVIFPKQGML